MLSGNSIAVNHINTSSRKLKQGFRRVNQTDILEKVNQLEISTWNYKNDASKTHMGPMAEDFQSLFGLGDGQHISTVDSAGVILAAIQGLKQEKDDQIQALKQENMTKTKEILALKSELADIKVILQTLQAEQNN